MSAQSLRPRRHLFKQAGTRAAKILFHNHYLLTHDVLPIGQVYRIVTGCNIAYRNCSQFLHVHFLRHYLLSLCVEEDETYLAAQQLVFQTDVQHVFYRIGCNADAVGMEQV